MSREVATAQDVAEMPILLERLQASVAELGASLAVARSSLPAATVANLQTLWADLDASVAAGLTTDRNNHRGSAAPRGRLTADTYLSDGNANASGTAADLPAVGTGPLPNPDRVCMGASVPAKAAPGSEFVARFLAYRREDAEQVRDLLLKSEGDIDRRRSLGAHVLGLVSGTTVEVQIQTGPAIQPVAGSSTRRQMVWTGEPLVEEFELRVADSPGVNSAVVRYVVSLEGIVLRQLSLEIQIGLSETGRGRDQVSTAAFPRSAFASYASNNRDRVLDRVMAMRTLCGIDVFVDCLDICPGRPWQPELERQILQRDLFILFWSTAAAKSRWVRWEYERACIAKPAESLQIQPLENGIKPPRALRHLHFADPLNDVRDAALARSARSIAKGN